VGVAGSPVIGSRRGGVLNITAAAWTAGFLSWRSGNEKRMQNVSEYMFVLALCLVILVDNTEVFPTKIIHRFSIKRDHTSSS